MREARRLRDILEAADELAQYMDGVSEEDFLEDRMRQRAVERLLGIIGEACKQLPESLRASIDQPWKQIIRFRDRVVHAYDSVSVAAVYSIARTGVPGLVVAIRNHVRAGKQA